MDPSTTLSKEDLDVVNEAMAKIPSIEDILSEAMAEIPSRKLSGEYIKNNFNESVIQLEKIAHELYIEYEKKTFPYMIELWVSKNRKLIEDLGKELSDIDFAKEICKSFYPLARTFEFKAGQKRKARGGRSFQKILGVLLRKIGVECEQPSKEGAKKLKRIDLVIPNQQIALSRPDQAFFLSCKRTLRERWKQTIPERKPSWRVFLVTIDDELPEDKAKEIDQLGIIAYVRDELKAKKHLAEKEWIRRLSDLPRDIGL